MYLSPDHHHTSIRRPRNCQSLAPELHSRRTRLAPHVPEPARAVAAHRRQFGLLCRIPSHALNATRVAPQLRAVLHLRLLGVPYPQRAVCGAGCYQVARWVPGDGADSGAASGWSEGFCVGKRAVNVRTCESLGLERRGRGMFGL